MGGEKICMFLSHVYMEVLSRDCHCGTELGPAGPFCCQLPVNQPKVSWFAGSILSLSIEKWADPHSSCGCRASGAQGLDVAWLTSSHHHAPANHIIISHECPSCVRSPGARRSSAATGLISMNMGMLSAELGPS